MMDSHIHPPHFYGNIVDGWNNINDEYWREILSNLSATLIQRNIKKGLMYILDEDWKENNLIYERFPENIIPSVLWKFECNDLDKRLDILLSQGIKIIKVLPYEQNILRKDYLMVYELAKKIQVRNMVLSICCSYGSEFVYDTNGVELTAFLINKGIKSPIIMAHGGMVKIFDAMSLMMECKNLYMDISFTLPFWWGSTVIDDYAFALKKLNYDRVFYGSDFPYVTMEESTLYFEKFCKKYNLEDRQISKIVELNFNEFIAENKL